RTGMTYEKEAPGEDSEFVHFEEEELGSDPEESIEEETEEELVISERPGVAAVTQPLPAARKSAAKKAPAKLAKKSAGKKLKAKPKPKKKAKAAPKKTKKKKAEKRVRSAARSAEHFFDLETDSSTACFAIIGSGCIWR